MDQLIATLAAGLALVLLIATHLRTRRIEAVLREILETLDGDDEMDDAGWWREGRPWNESDRTP